MGKHTDFRLSFFQIVGAWRDFTVFTKLIKNFKISYGFGGRLKIRDNDRSQGSFILNSDWSIRIWARARAAVEFARTLKFK